MCATGINPAIKGDCSGLQSDVFVCIGKSGYATTISTGTPVPVTPTPAQTGMVSGCLRFYDVQSGEGCADIVSQAGVAQTDFYNWKPGCKHELRRLASHRPALELPAQSRRPLVELQ
ncbi:hypothetical protein PENARI_c002G11384 [Penicillium arizonense]|uniref:LysM domain-containing protein n=1 Tax=Penicillium arizonense TaxID=1835702 RepID=A0A1F5LUV7_PENAI|nr:hypothetical protein PENARI_c002G11384 [Penicillium arizonense]OGE56965.1 hypothetical protein PENARI_c002G11384 [Penicillium arizonense]